MEFVLNRHCLSCSSSFVYWVPEVRLTVTAEPVLRVIGSVLGFFLRYLCYAVPDGL